MLVHLTNGVWRPLAQLRRPDAGGAAVSEARDRRPRAGVRVHGAGPAAPGGTRTRGRCADGDDWLLTGEKHLITFADRAHLLPLIAASDDRTGEGLADRVPRPARHARLRDRRHPAHDGTARHRPRLAALPPGAGGRLAAPRRGRPGARGRPSLPRLQPHLAVDVHGRAGASRRSTRRSAFAKRRVTFGRPIAERQAIQAHLADMRPTSPPAAASCGRPPSAARTGEDYTAQAAIGEALLPQHGRPGHRPVPARARRLRLHHRCGHRAHLPRRPRLLVRGGHARRSSSWSWPATCSTPEAQDGAAHTIVRPPLTL